MVGHPEAGGISLPDRAPCKRQPQGHKSSPGQGCCTQHLASLGSPPRESLLLQPCSQVCLSQAFQKVKHILELPPMQVCIRNKKEEKKNYHSIFNKVSGEPQANVTLFFIDESAIKHSIPSPLSISHCKVPGSGSAEESTGEPECSSPGCLEPTEGRWPISTARGVSAEWGMTAA